MPTFCFLLFAGLLGMGEGKAPLPLEVRLFHESAPLDGSIRIVARPVDRLEPGIESVEVPVLAEGIHNLTLSDSQRWEVSCIGEAVWCPTLQVDTESVEEENFLPIFPAVVLSGRMISTDSPDLPSEITVQGWVHLSAAAKPVTSFLSTVQIEESGRFQFIAPMGFLDLRIAAKDRIPIYLWHFDTGKEPANLQPLRLQRGGSVAGFVWDAVEEMPAKDASVTLVPAGEQRDAAMRERLNRLATRVRTSDRGFFQIAGVAPGEYRLEVDAPQRAPLRVEPIEVIEDSEIYFKKDLQLTSPIRVEVMVDPPVDPDGEPWQVSLYPRLPEGTDDREIPRSASSAGIAVFSELIPQDYRLKIGTVMGSTVVSRWVTISHSDTLFVSLSLIFVEGAVSLNGEPIAAKIELQTGRRDQRVLETMNERGEFEGWMLQPELKVLFVTVTAEEPPISRRLVFKKLPITNQTLKLNLELEGEDVSGMVVDDRERPIYGAEVFLYSGRDQVARKETDNGGHFTFFALAEGSYHVRARHRSKGDSESVAFDLTGGSAPFLELVIVPRRTLQGVVLSHEGRPVAGADVEIFTIGANPTVSGQPTDVEGKFRIRVSSQASRAVFQVLAASQMLWSGCRWISETEPVTLTLPPVPGGTLELEITSDPELPPTTGGRLLLFTSEGGFLELATLRKWRWMAGTPSGFGRDEDPTELLAVERIAAGTYAVTWSKDPWWHIASTACAFGLPPELDRAEVLPGGHAVLSYDLREFQAQEAGE